jgi:arylsulfatase A-like enzyme
MTTRRSITASIVAGCTLFAVGCSVQKNRTRAGSEVLPYPDPQFQGVISPAGGKSVASWAKEVTAKKGAPNVILILVDDVGFSATSTFGGLIQTPNFDKLAADGLRYNNFHVNAICSPTRASLLTGRNSEEVGFGAVAEAASGFPGYNSLWPKSAASIAEVLKDHGYSTAAFGKWHNTPTWQVGPAGPFDRWPTGFGFQHFYGFLAGYDNQYYPRLFHDTVPVEPPTTPQQGYSFTADMTDEAIRWLHQQEAVTADKPFFLYYAPGATHAPHQVPKSWIEKYKGKFDAGWDQIRLETFERQKKLGVIPANAELTPRPAGLPAWNSLATDEKKLYAHQAEVYAAFAEQTDYEIGRLLNAIRDSGKSENTLVIEIFGDNGASAEGGPSGYDAKDAQGNPLLIQQRLALSDADGSELYMNNFAAAWAWALSSPFQGTKLDAAHLGGTTDPMIISWPARIHSVGGLRTQFQHVNDIAPTIYQAADIKPPDIVNGTRQIPLEGSSLIYTFDYPNEPSHHHVQYFSTLGNRAIYQDGWWADRHDWSSWDNDASGKNISRKTNNRHLWELYYLANDYSQAHNVAAKYPEKLKQLQQLFDEEARRNQVYPISQPAGKQPLPVGVRPSYIYRDGVERLPNDVVPTIVGRKHTITADIDIPPQGARGVIIAQGSRYGGFTLFVKDRHVVYEINAYGNRTGQLVSLHPLKPGKVHIVLQVQREPDAMKASASTPLGQPGNASLTINGVAEGSAKFTNIEGSSYTETLDVGSDLGSPVSSSYASPNRFTGTIESVAIAFP